MDVNRFAPPRARVDDPLELAVGRRPAYAVAVAALVQLGLVLLFARTYWELISTGETSLLVGLVSLVACLLLYTGSLRFARSGLHGKRSLLSAGMGLAWSTYAWHFPFPFVWAFPFLLGALIGFVGWWLVRGNQSRTSRASAL